MAQKWELVTITQRRVYHGNYTRQDVDKVGLNQRVRVMRVIVTPGLHTRVHAPAHEFQPKITLITLMTLTTAILSISESYRAGTI